MKSGGLNFLDLSEPVIGLYRDCFAFTVTFMGTGCA
jgi:hypothetical protein